MDRLASFRALWTAPGWGSARLDTRGTEDRRELGTCQIALVGMDGHKGVYAAMLFDAGRKGELRERGREEGTNWDCWLTTTFERIWRREVTTAAQESSAEDSRARTVKLRAAWRRRGRARMWMRGSVRRRRALCMSVEANPRPL